MSLGFSRHDSRFCGMGQQPGVILLVLLMFFSAIGVRLVWMQLLHGAENRVAADENRIRLMPRSPIRGRLLDRKGRVLASSKLTYTLFIEPRLVTDEQWPALRDRLAGLMQLDPKGLDQARERELMVMYGGVVFVHLVAVVRERGERAGAVGVEVPQPNRRVGGA